MNQEQYERLVASVERESQQHPALYKAKLGGMAALGYGYVGAVLALLVAALALFVWMLVHRSGAVLAVKLLIVVVPLVWAVLQAMFVTMDPPTGREVAVDAAPELASLVESVRRSVGAPQAHKILLTPEFNAAVVQHPRLGVFGWPRNYLILGLPLMQALTLEEFGAVLAHEFGHLSGSHGKFGAWIYRLRAGWARLAAALDQSDHWGRFLFVPFFNWYAPAFAAYSFVQARRQEYEADRVSAAVAGASIAAAALVRVELQSEFLQREYWRRIFREADSAPQPQAQPFASMRTAFTQPRNDSAHTLEAALKVKTGSDDTHPCLSDRLAALKARPVLPEAVKMSAADALLGPAAAAFSAGFDREWRENVSAWWRDRHQYAMESRTKLARLDESAKTRELSVDDAHERAALTEELVGAVEARAQFEALAARAPDHAPTLFAIGRMKLTGDDESGIALLRSAVALDPAATQAASSIIVDYLRRHGRNEEARPYLDELAAGVERDRLADKERGGVTTSDDFLPHELPEETVAELVEQLRRIPDVKSAWLVRKKTRYAPERPLYILGVRRRISWWQYERSASEQELVHQINEGVQFPGETFIISLGPSNKSFRRKFRRVAHSLIHTQA